METYYCPEDLPKFEDIGKASPELAKKFFDYYGAVFAEGQLTEREKSLAANASRGHYSAAEGIAELREAIAGFNQGAQAPRMIRGVEMLRSYVRSMQS